MKYILLFLILFSARSARSQYELGIKGHFPNASRPDSVCLTKGRDSLMVVLDKKRTILPVDSVRYLTFREHKSWWPYLLVAGFVGQTAYTILHFVAKDDGMYSAEGKAIFVGVLSGGFTLLVGTAIKDAKETQVLIDPWVGLDNAGVNISCDF